MWTKSLPNGVALSRRFANKVPQEEAEGFEFLTGHLDSLRDYVARFNACLALRRHAGDVVRNIDEEERKRIPDQIASIDDIEPFMKRMEERREQRRMIHEWTFIACRDAVMTMFHFGMTIDSINTQVSKLPLTSAYFLKSELRAATRLFRKSFPDFEAVRNSVAHEAENVRSPEKIDAHALIGDVNIFGVIAADAGHPESSFFMAGSILNDEYTWTYKGRVVSLNLTARTTSILQECVELFFRALLNEPPVQSRTPQH